MTQIKYDKNWCKKSSITQENSDQFKIDEKHFIDNWHSRTEPVIPRMGGFWLGNEFHSYNSQHHICEKCGEEHNQHYTNQILCHECSIKFQTTWLAISQFECDKRFKKAQLIYKNRNKPVQLTVNFENL